MSGRACCFALSIPFPASSPSAKQSRHGQPHGRPLVVRHLSRTCFHAHRRSLPSPSACGERLVKRNSRASWQAGFCLRSMSQSCRTELPGLFGKAWKHAEISVCNKLRHAARARKTKPHEKLGFMRFFNGAQGRNRTSDTRIFSPLLYQLSYLGLAARVRRKPAYRENLEACPAVQPSSSGSVWLCFVRFFWSFDRVTHDTITLIEPAGEIDVGAARRAERPI